MEIGALRRDTAQIDTGAWVGDIQGMEDVRLRVRGMSSPTVAALRSKKERKVGNDGRERDGNLTPETARRVLGEVLSEGVLLEWDGLTSNGKPIPYDAALAKTWLTDPDYAPFAEAVIWAAQVVDRGRANLQAAMEKNSAAPSSGSSKGAA